MVRKSIPQRWSYVLLAGVVAACSSSSTATQDDGDASDDGGGALESDGSPTFDARPGSDAQSGSDAHEIPDASVLDADHAHDAHDAAVTDAAPPPIDAATFDAGCSNPGTPTLHPHANPGVFCPFGPGGAPLLCAATEECCEPPVASGTASNCQAGATTCATIGSAVWGCEETLDCSGGKVCCAAGTIALDPVCGYLRGSVTLAASACATSCGGGELHLCASQAECSGGTICTAFKVKGLELGACL